jgi:hypothetical protein
VLISTECPNIDTDMGGWRGIGFRYKDFVFFGDPDLLKQIAAELQVAPLH